MSDLAISFEAFEDSQVTEQSCVERLLCDSKEFWEFSGIILLVLAFGTYLRMWMS